MSIVCSSCSSSTPSSRSRADSSPAVNATSGAAAAAQAGEHLGHPGPHQRGGQPVGRLAGLAARMVSAIHCRIRGAEQHQRLAHRADLAAQPVVAADRRHLEHLDDESRARGAGRPRPPRTRCPRPAASSRAAPGPAAEAGDGGAVHDVGPLDGVALEQLEAERHRAARCPRGSRPSRPAAARRRARHRSTRAGRSSRLMARKSILTMRGELQQPLGAGRSTSKSSRASRNPASTSSRQPGDRLVVDGRRSRAPR